MTTPAADVKYQQSRARLRRLVDTPRLTPGVRARLDQYGQGLRTALELAGVDLTDPIAERAVIRTLDVLLMATHPGRHDAWRYLAELTGGLTLNLRVDQDSDQ